MKRKALAVLLAATMVVDPARMQQLPQILQQLRMQQLRILQMQLMMQQLQMQQEIPSKE